MNKSLGVWNDVRVSKTEFLFWVKLTFIVYHKTLSKAQIWLKICSEEINALLVAKANNPLSPLSSSHSAFFYVCLHLLLYISLSRSLCVCLC